MWRARHRLLARDAAIKVVRTSTANDARSVISEDARERFEREAQATALLRSPHTVELFDFGVSTDGAFYYVMELLEGLDADTLVRRFGPVPAERAIYLLRQGATPSPKPSRAGWSTVTSSRPIFSSASTARITTS